MDRVRIDRVKLVTELTKRDMTQTRLAAIRRSLPKTPEELERQFPPVEFKRKKSDAG